MLQFLFPADGIEGTDRLGQALADILPGGTTVALVGTLGAGKTRLVQAVAAALNIRPEAVTSPTFVLCHEYHGIRSLYHFDCYRIGNEDEFLELGPEEYFESSAIVMVEWADRVQRCLPPQRLEIHVEVLGETARQFTVLAVGDAYKPIVEELRNRLGVSGGEG